MRAARSPAYVHAEAQLVLCHAGRKRPGTQLQADRHHSEMLAEDHRDLLRGERWKLQRVRSLSTLPSDADLLASLKQGEGVPPCSPDALISFEETQSAVSESLSSEQPDSETLDERLLEAAACAWPESAAQQCQPAGQLRVERGLLAARAPAHAFTQPEEPRRTEVNSILLYVPAACSLALITQRM